MFIRDALSDKSQINEEKLQMQRQRVELLEQNKKFDNLLENFKQNYSDIYQQIEEESKEQNAIEVEQQLTTDEALKDYEDSLTYCMETYNNDFDDNIKLPQYIVGEKNEGWRSAYANPSSLKSDIIVASKSKSYCESIMLNEEQQKTLAELNELPQEVFNILLKNFKEFEYSIHYAQIKPEQDRILHTDIEVLRQQSFEKMTQNNRKNTFVMQEAIKKVQDMQNLREELKALKITDNTEFINTTRKTNNGTKRDSI